MKTLRVRKAFALREADAAERAAVEFVFKHHIVHAPSYHFDAFPGGERTVHLWWEGSFTARERQT